MAAHSENPEQKGAPFGQRARKLMLSIGDRLDPTRIPFLRYVPRGVWLSLSFLVLVLSSALLYTQLDSRRGPLWQVPFSLRSSTWWTTPFVFRADRQLPDFKGAIHGVAVDGDRVWVVGERGFLAYSEDNGRCWTRLEYVSDTSDANAAGGFREPASKCSGSNTVSTGSIFPIATTVYAAELPPAQAPVSQSKLPNGNSNPPPQNTANQGPKGSGPIQSRITLQPSLARLDFGDVVVGTTSMGRSVTIQYSTSGIFAQILEKDRPSRTFSLGPSSTPSDMVVYFSPVSTGRHSAELIVSPPPDSRGDLYTGSVKVELTGRGIDLNKPETSTKDSRQNGVEPPKWSPPQNPPSLLAIDFVKPGRGRIVASNGTVFQRDAGDRTWRVNAQQARTTLSYADGHSWSFDDAQNGYWATQGKEATARWRPQPYPYLCAVCQIWAFSEDSKSAWAIGRGTFGGAYRQDLLYTRDPEGRWWPASRSALSDAEQKRLADEDKGSSLLSVGSVRTVPPWYVVSIFLSLVLSLPALARPEGKASPDGQTDSVESVLISDRPLEPADPDVLGLKGIALGLSRFLRNEKTAPPLTVAINGEWGTGKSSLMNLLRCDLESYGFRPVWFNAWHHQKEEHLLAALLQSIRRDALPPMWQWQGALFRLKLLGYRTRRGFPLLVVLLAVLLLISTLEFRLISQGGHGFITWTLDFVRSLASPQVQPGTDDHGAIGKVPLFSLVLALAATLRMLSVGLTGFGANPSSLLWTLTDGQKVKNLDQQSSFRQRFAGEFREVTAALNPTRPLVIFIDDLDRCSPGNVLQVLEAVNFLVSSGDCFIILGMSRRPVEGAVAFSLKDVAPNMGKEPMAFARDYLDKLINIEVPIPRAESTRRGQLFQARTESATNRPQLDWLMRSLRCLQWAMPLLLTGVFLWGAVRLGSTLANPVSSMMKEVDDSKKPPSPPGPAKPTQDASPSPATGTGPVNRNLAAAKEPKGQAVPTPVPSEVPDQPSTETTVRDGGGLSDSVWLELSPSYVLLILLFLTLQIVLSTRPGVVTRDSNNFALALGIWHPLVLLRQDTPRTAKRFVNRVRFLAMRQDPGRTIVPAWEQTLFPNRLNSAGDVVAERIPEELLVALAAIEQIEPEWIYDGAKFEAMVSGPIAVSQESLPGSLSVLKTARAQHQDKWGANKWEDIRRYRKRFLEIWPQITTR